MTIRFVTRSDDLGSFTGVAPAALAGHRSGYTQNTSVLAVAPHTEAACALLRAHPGPCIGLHLAICCEWRIGRWRPASPPGRVPSLVDQDGFLHSDPLRIHQAGVVFEEVMRECQAQLDRLRALRLDVRYVDTHMGWEWIHPLPSGPRATELIGRWCRREGLRWDGAQPWSVLPAPPPGGTVRSRTLWQLDRAKPGLYVQHLHPCWPGAAIAEQDFGGGPGLVQRERIEDAETIQDHGLVDDLRRRGIELVRYDQLPL
jgi:hypothetical protein